MWPFIGGALGAVAQFFGGQQTNSSNETIAKDATAANMAEAARNRQFQATSAKEQMEFQERMSSTAMQRGVEDAKKAGINPILMGNTGGSSSPSGASASGSQGTAVAAKLENPLSGASSWINSALQAMQQAGALEKQGAETKLIQQQTKTESGKGPEADIKTRLYDWFNKALKTSQQNSAKPARNKTLPGYGLGLDGLPMKKQ